LGWKYKIKLEDGIKSAYEDFTSNIILTFLNRKKEISCFKGIYMTNTICLDKKYSTTRLLHKKSLNINTPWDKFETLPYFA
jgi:hypothetical protein